ncbi:MAG: acyl-ACP--UDP-N-acetylglucosamine O-acyltransferase [Thermoguttaceae bacterium]|nr:acyl-ACP--UDP-N-acetylglucosamine O-acyltransferase [Thermoguttaceae bacterium]
MEIHETAIVSPKAKIGEGCKFGPYTIVEDDVEIGENCVFDAFSVVRGGTKMGNGNHLFEGAVVGGHPQCLGLEHSSGRAVIGDNNLIREHCTVHRSMRDDGVTEIGSDNMLMVNVHVAHDCRIGNHVLISNNTMMAGHVSIDDRAVVSGAVGIHQFCRIGTMAMVGGQAHVTKDILPFTLIDGKMTEVGGLNMVGIKRNGIGREDVGLLKEIYLLVYLSGAPWKEIVRELNEKYNVGAGKEIVRFVNTTKRGILRAHRSHGGAGCGPDETPEDAANV